jgi:hypothetical protein
MCDMGTMIPMKPSNIFKNRWWALLWAAGIIWFAYDFAGSAAPTDNSVSNEDQATDATGAPVTTDDEKRLAAAINSF